MSKIDTTKPVEPVAKTTYYSHDTGVVVSADDFHTANAEIERLKGRINVLTFANDMLTVKAEKAESEIERLKLEAKAERLVLKALKEKQP